MAVPINSSTALTNSVNKGAGYQMKYIEIYRKDVTHLLNATRYAHTVLPSPSNFLIVRHRHLHIRRVTKNAWNAKHIFQIRADRSAYFGINILGHPIPTRGEQFSADSASSG